MAGFGTMTWAQVYGASMPNVDAGDLREGYAEAASGDDDIEAIVEDAKPNMLPAIWLLAIIGGLVILRVAYEFAGGDE